MRFVERAEIRPMHCAVHPTLGARHRGGYIDTGTDLPGFDNRVYVSVEAVENLAKFVGHPSKVEHAEALARVEELERRCADLEQQLAEADKELGAVYTLRQKGWAPSKKPGRPPKQPVAD